MVSDRRSGDGLNIKMISAINSGVLETTIKIPNMKKYIFKLFSCRINGRGPMVHARRSGDGLNMKSISAIDSENFGT